MEANNLQMGFYQKPKGRKLNKRSGQTAGKGMELAHSGLRLQAPIPPPGPPVVTNENPQQAKSQQ